MEASQISVPFYRSRRPVPSPRLRRFSDQELVEQFRAGRDDAFRVIHDRYRARLLAYARQMLSGRSSEDVEDVVQDVFERAARTLRAEGTPVTLPAWLYGVAHNRCIDELRRRPPASPDVYAAARLPAVDTSAVAERRADIERLFSDLARLPELQRSALLMRELQGLSHAELAGVLDASVPAVKSLLVRARTGLVDAREARSVPCAAVREDLAGAHDRRVKASAQAARHLRECTACRSYRTELRRTSRRLAALVPGPTLLPLGLLGRLLGGSGAHAEAPAAAIGLAGSGGGVVAGAGKLAALLSAATVVTTGAVLEHDGSLGGRPPRPAPAAAPPRAAAPARSGARLAPGARSRPAAGKQPAGGRGSSTAPPAGGSPQAGRGSPSAAPPPVSGQTGATGGPGPASPGATSSTGGGPSVGTAQTGAGAAPPGAAAATPTTGPASGASIPGGASSPVSTAVGTLAAGAGQAASAAPSPSGSVSAVSDTVSKVVAGTGIGPAVAAPTVKAGGQLVPGASGLPGPLH